MPRRAAARASVTELVFRGSGGREPTVAVHKDVTVKRLIDAEVARIDAVGYQGPI